MSYEITAYTRPEAEASNVDFIGLPLNEDSANTHGPSICRPENVAGWMFAHLKTGSLAPGAYTTSCDILKTDDKVGKVWVPTEMLFIAEELTQSAN